MVSFPSPAVAIVGRHNSGKTSLIEKLIAQLVARGHNVGSIKHHSHVGFDIDYPGKDSYRHRAAGASETVIAAPGQMACIKTLEGEMECGDIVRGMPGHDLIVVEGYRKSGLPTIEIMRSGNQADRRVAHLFAEGSRQGWPLGTDFTQWARRMTSTGNEVNAKPAFLGEEESQPSDAAHFVALQCNHLDITNKLPTANTVAVVSDIDEAIEAAGRYCIPAFDLKEITQLVSFLEEHFVRPRLSIAIQAGGESRRMGRSKATVPFAGRPLISRLVERLGSVADEVLITTNEPQHLGFLETEFPQLHVKLVRDVCDCRGALPGLYTALCAAQNPFVAVVACDMVFASSSLIVAQALSMNRTGADVVVPVNKHGFEPFHAMYRRSTCLPAVKWAIDKGQKRAQAFFSRVEVCEMPQVKVLEVEPRGGCFINVNTPEELRAIEESFLEG